MTASAATIARELVGAPYRAFGRSRSGLDCAGLVVLIARELGWTVADEQHYNATLSSGLFARKLAASFPSGDRNEIGAVLLFRLHGLEHAGVRTSATKMVHAWRRAGRVVETTIPESWARMITGAFRLAGNIHG